MITAANISDASQRNAVSEGFALGLLMNGLDTISYKNYHMTSVNLSLSYAWRHWSFRTRFPKVDRDFTNRRTEHYIVTHASERHRTSVFYWDDYEIVARSNWSFPEEFEEAAGFIDEQVPAREWMKLVEMFVSRLQDSSSKPHLEE